MRDETRPREFGRAEATVSSLSKRQLCTLYQIYGRFVTTPAALFDKRWSPTGWGEPQG